MSQRHEDIRFQRVGKAGVVTLARPGASNLLTHLMIKALATVLETWANDDAVRFVVVRAAGPVFCAGVDHLELAAQARSRSVPLAFFADHYRLGARIAKYPKPVVSVVDGPVHGAGLTLAFLGSHRVMTEHATFDTPETGIGFFPDGGATFVLPSLSGSVGKLLGLCGVRISWGDALWCGLATHALASQDVLPLLNEMCREDEPDSALARFGQSPPRETDDATVFSIATHFSRDSLAGIGASLRYAAGPRDLFARRMLHLLETKSPTSLAIAFNQIESGGMLTVDECMRMEFRIVNRIVESPDFPEGVRARARKVHPYWHPETIREIDLRQVERFFEPLPGRELRV